jgi:Holliday junction resolvase RusA-like endonuclease
MSIGFKLNVKPLSINKAFQGRRFKTPEYKNYEEECLLLINSLKKSFKEKKISGLIVITYDFYLKNFNLSDVGNMEKLLSDIVVKAGLIDDDRFVKRFILEKYQVDKTEDECIVVKIEPYEL